MTTVNTPNTVYATLLQEWEQYGEGNIVSLPHALQGLFIVRSDSEGQPPPYLKLARLVDSTYPSKEWKVNGFFVKLTHEESLTFGHSNDVIYAITPIGSEDQRDTVLVVMGGNRFECICPLDYLFRRVSVGVGRVYEIDDGKKVPMATKISTESASKYMKRCLRSISYSFNPHNRDYFDNAIMDNGWILGATINSCILDGKM